MRETVARGLTSVRLVEDDEAVRSVARRILVAHAYAVREAASGAEGVGL